MNTLDFFAQSVGSDFAVQLDGGSTLPVTLIEAAPLPDSGYPGMARAPFQLVFHGDDSILLHQMNHRLKHEILGDLEIFLVPIGQEPGVFVYQAVFN